MSEKKKKAQKPAEVKKKTPAKKGKKESKKSAKESQKPVKKNNINGTTAKTGRKQRTDSIQHHVTAAQGAYLTLSPPENVKLLKKELDFFNAIIDEFAKIEWTKHTLQMAAMLARHMYALEIQQRKLRSEGDLLDRKQIIPAIKDKSTGKIIEKAKAVVISQYLNPRKSNIQMYSDLIVKFRRSLSLHARGQQGETRDITARRTASKSAERSMIDDDDDDLLARPITTH